MITPENVKEVVARELRIISKEMYNPTAPATGASGWGSAEV